MVEAHDEHARRRGPAARRVQGAGRAANRRPAGASDLSLRGLAAKPCAPDERQCAEAGVGALGDGRRWHRIAAVALLSAWAPYGDGDLPAPVAVLYKIAVGVDFTTAAMWQDRVARFDAPVGAE